MEPDRGNHVLKALTQRGAEIGPADGPTAVTLDLPLLPAPATGVIPAVAGLTTNTPAAAPVGLPPGMPVMPPQDGMRRPPQSN